MSQNKRDLILGLWEVSEAGERERERARGYLVGVALTWIVCIRVIKFEQSTRTRKFSRSRGKYISGQTHSGCHSGDFLKFELVQCLLI